MNTSNRKPTILLTGASSGIGLEMAKMLAAQQYNLVLVARNREKLLALQSEFSQKHGVEVTIFPMDLSEEGGAESLFDQVKSAGIEIEMLVNNAGVGDYGKFLSSDLTTNMAMIQLNISSLVALSQLFGREMALRNHGRIMNVASLLSFIPFPYYSVYSATKSFVLSFTETFAAEMEGTGVVVTALCPGPVDTPFQTQEMYNTNAYKASKPVKPEVVAKAGVKLLLHGKGKKIVGFNNWFISNLPRVTPDWVMMRVKKGLAGQR